VEKLYFPYLAEASHADYGVWSARYLQLKPEFSRSRQGLLFAGYETYTTPDRMLSYAPQVIYHHDQVSRSPENTEHDVHPISESRPASEWWFLWRLMEGKIASQKWIRI
jgi:hypothetical protein